MSNIFLARMRSEEFVETWRVKGTRNRLTGLDWEQLSLNTLLVDPPRWGGGHVIGLHHGVCCHRRMHVLRVWVEVGYGRQGHTRSCTH